MVRGINEDVRRTIVLNLKRGTINLIPVEVGFDENTLNTAFQARKPFAELQNKSVQLREVWPESWACAHHRLFLQDRVHLHLHY